MRGHTNNNLSIHTKCRNTVFLLVGLLCLPSISAYAASITSNVSATISNSPGVIILDNDETGFLHTLPSDSISRSASVDSVYADGTHIAALNNAAFGLGGNWFGTSLPNTPTRQGTGGGFMRFTDEILISSSSLADNTPVAINFSLHVASALFQNHTNPIPAFNQPNASLVDLQFEANINSSFSSASNIRLDAADHRRFEYLNNSSIVEGILNPATPHLDLVYNGFVGETVTFILTLESRVFGSVNQSAGGNSVSESGQGYGAVSVAFGATPVDSNVSLSSAAFGSAFPGMSQANAMNAQMALVGPTPVPLPPGIVLMLGGVGLLARFGARAA